MTQKVTPKDLLDQDDFSGIILSKKLLKKLGVDKHPWLHVSIKNNIPKNGEVIDLDMVACMVHEEGWGFSTIENDTRDHQVDS